MYVMRLVISWPTRISISLVKVSQLTYHPALNTKSFVVSEQIMIKLFLWPGERHTRLLHELLKPP